MTGPGKPRVAAIAAALGAAVLFGARTPLAKQLVAAAHPVVIAGLRYLGSGADLLALWLARGGAMVSSRIAAMFWSSRPLRKLLAVLMAAAMLWSVGAEACSDSLEHEQSHTAALGGEGNGDPSSPGVPAEHDRGCHACHHLPAHLAPAALVPETAAALPRPAAHAIPRRGSAPDLPSPPPRAAILA